MIDKIKKLVNQLKMFPGVGDKSAKRMVYFLLNQGPEKINKLSEEIKDLNNIKKCKTCGVFTEDELCKYCSSDIRNDNIICVVEVFNDVQAIEDTGVYNGVYHILGGHISPVDGIFLDDLNIDSLFDRIDEDTEEIII